MAQLFGIVYPICIYSQYLNMLKYDIPKQKAASHSRTRRLPRHWRCLGGGGGNAGGQAGHHRPEAEKAPPLEEASWVRNTKVVLKRLPVNF